MTDDKSGLAGKPWTLERALHLTLAAVAILGWSIAYTALMRQIETPQDIAHDTVGPGGSVSPTPRT
jgi:hypothetical protein